MYGKAGAFRPKPYGMEYRVLSNKWLTNTRLQSWVYDTTVLAMENLSKQQAILDPDAQLIINNSDQDLAKKAIKKYNLNSPV
jgi:hypothetical protein